MRCSTALGIVAPSYAVAGVVDTVRAWANAHAKPRELAERMSSNGLHRFFRADEEESIASLCVRAARETLQRARCEPDSIELIVYFHTLHDSILPAPDSICGVLRHELGLRRARGFSVSQQQCVSFLAALRVVAGLMTHSALRRVLIVGADKATHEPSRNIEDVGIQSDGACAALIERDVLENTFLGARFQTFGEHYEGMASSAERTAELNRIYYVTTFRLIAQLIEDSGVKRSDIKKILPHNVNAPGWQRIVRALGLDTETLFDDNIAAKGHIYGCDGIVNLRDCEDAGQLDSGQFFVIFSMGYGGTFGAALFRR